MGSGPEVSSVVVNTKCVVVNTGKSVVVDATTSIVGDISVVTWTLVVVADETVVVTVSVAVTGLVVVVVVAVSAGSVVGGTVDIVTVVIGNTVFVDPVWFSNRHDSKSLTKYISMPPL